MGKEKKRYIGFFCESGKVIAFDFGSFVIIVQYVSAGKLDQDLVSVYFGDDYQHRFLESTRFDKDFFKSVEVAEDAFLKIEIAGLDYCKSYAAIDALWNLLEKNFANQMKHYRHK